ncbi:MAG: DUF5118 domain-containing protein, partial [Bacteroidota bacterium]|nr:DUF5118 domain-containing protein [Bacteroidota bacterium]
MKSIFCLSICLALTSRCFSQQIPPTPATKKLVADAKPAAVAPKSNPKPYKEVITDKAVTQHGLFTVHKVDDKWYFE